MHRFLIYGLLISLVSLPCPLTAVSQNYEARWESLDRHPIPTWFQDAKFGIFVYWGLSSVPAWAPVGSYSEWYWNAMSAKPDAKSKINPTADYHNRVYGKNFDYQQFAPMFKAEMFNPEEWAEIIAKSGAKYALLNAKHHDGFCMFQSTEANRSWGMAWNAVDTGPQRDVLGELTDAVRKQGIKMGIYYSLYEWSNPLWLTNKEAYIEKHLFPQFKDVVNRYKPEIIFSDGEWDLSSKEWRSEELLAWLFNESACKENVVINDRWGKDTRHKHGDYYTTEYTSGMNMGDHPWEENRGIGYSYAFNRNESLKDYKTSRELVLMLIDLVSRGGNLFLDIGPTGDGRIPVIMQERLVDIGNWLKINGEAIYGTRAWKVSRQWTAGVMPSVDYNSQFMAKYDINQITRHVPGGNKAVVQAFFTKKGNTLNAICPNWPKNGLELKDVVAAPDSRVLLLGYNEPLQWKQEGSNLVIEVPAEIPEELSSSYAYSFKIENMK